jgi:hypothetical protein
MVRNWGSFNCFNTAGRAVSSAGLLGGSNQEFVIAAEGVFGDVELGHGGQAPGGPQAVVIAQGREVQLTAAELSPQIALHSGQVVGSGGDMEGVHHDLGGLIRRQGRQELAP